MTTLPGTPTLYYGDEIGMTDISDDSVCEDVRCREKCRSPMQWDNSTNAGFGTADDGEPWIQVNDNYMTVNVENELANDTSTLNLYKNLISLRKDNLALARGWYCRYNGDVSFQKNILAFSREQEGIDDGFLILINLSDERTEIELDREGDALVIDDSSILDSKKAELEPYGYMVIRYAVSVYEFANNDYCWVSQRAKISKGVEMKV